jgi:copper chaperone CopZ
MANDDPRAATTAHHQHVSVRRGTFELRGVHCLGCAGAVERALREQPHITEVRLDWKNDVVHVRYDPDRLGPEDIEEIITQTGCDCKPTDVED